MIGLFSLLVFSLIPSSQAQENSLEGNFDLNGEWETEDGDFFTITHTGSRLIASYYPDLGYCPQPGMRHIGTELIFDATIEGDQIQGQFNACYEDTMKIELSAMQLRVTDRGNRLEGSYIGKYDGLEDPLTFYRVSTTSSSENEAENVSKGEANLVIRVDVLEDTAEASDFMILVECGESAEEGDVRMYTCYEPFPGDEEGTYQPFTIRQDEELHYRATVNQMPTGNYSEDYEGQCEGILRVGSEHECIIRIKDTPPIGNENPVKTITRKAGEIPDRVDDFFRSFGSVAGTSSPESGADILPLIVVASIIVIGGIAVGKHSKNKNRGRRLKIPPSAVVNIHTKGGTRE